MTTARRLTAILAADVVGYSRLMDEAVTGGVYERREAARPIAFNANDRFPKPRPRGLPCDYGSFTASTQRLACSSNGPPLYRPRVIPVRMWPTTTAMICSIWSACSALVMK